MRSALLTLFVAILVSSEPLTSEPLTSVSISNVCPNGADTTPVVPTDVAVNGTGFESVPDIQCVFDTDGYRKGGYLSVPATVFSDTSLQCTVPSFRVESAAHLYLLTNDGAVKSNSVDFGFAKYVDAAASLSAFTCGGSGADSPTVDVLLKVSPLVLANASTAAGAVVHVDVSLVGGPKLVSTSVTPNGTLHRVSVPAASVTSGVCPFVGALNVSVSCASCPSTAASGPVPVELHPYQPNQVLIDRSNGGFVVGGAPYFPYGYLVNGKEDLPVMEAAMVDMAHRGMNTIMPYMCTHPVTNPPCVRMDAVVQLMDTAQTVGMRVQMSLLAVVQAFLDNPTNSATLAYLTSVIQTVKDHPALFGYYITDDTVSLNQTLVAQVYAAVHAADPLHPAINTNNNPELVWQYARPGAVGFDFSMYEEYDLADPTQSHDDQAIPHYWPMSFVSGGLCGQGFADDFTTVSAIRLQTYSSLVAGGTGVMLWDWWEWAALDSRVIWVSHVQLAAEVLELASGILSSVLTHPAADIKTVSSTDGGVTGRAWQRDDGAVYVVVINTSKNPAQFSVTAPFMSTAVPYNLVSVLWEDRVVNVSSVTGGATWTESVDGWGTRAYLYTPPAPTSRGKAEDRATPGPGTTWVANPEFDSIAPNLVSAWMPAWKFIAPTDSSRLDLFDFAADPLVRGPAGQRSLRINTRNVDNAFGFAFVPAPLVGKLDERQQYRYSVNVRAGLPVPYSSFNITLCGAVYPYFYPLTSAKGFTSPLMLGEADAFKWHSLSVTMYPDSALVPGVCVMGTGPVWIEDFQVVHL